MKIKEKSGIAFEKLVTRIQQQLDPAAKVTHNEILIDRLGHKRQFDVVIRGILAGYPMLGVIECKDLNRNVGTSAVEAFVTKSRDINANLKVLVSKRGFSRNAIEKARDHGIQTLSLFPQDANEPPNIGTRWYADIYHWQQVAMQLHFVQEPTERVAIDIDDVTINGKRVIDWFKNYLIREHKDNAEEGWVVNIKNVFDMPQSVMVGPRSFDCTGISFHALRCCEKKSKTMGWSGAAFYDWQTKQPKVPSNTTLSTYPIPIDFESWEDRGKEEIDKTAFLYGHLTVFAKNFEITPDAIDLSAL